MPLELPDDMPLELPEDMPLELLDVGALHRELPDDATTPLGLPDDVVFLKLDTRVRVSDIPGAL